MGADLSRLGLPERFLVGPNHEVLEILILPSPPSLYYISITLFRFKTSKSSTMATFSSLLDGWS